MERESMTLKKRCLKLAARGLAVVFAAGMVSLAAEGISALACTSYYAGKNVTTDGSILFGRTEDIGSAYSKNFLVREAAVHAEGEMYTDGTGFTMPYPAETFRYTACEDDPGHGGGPFGEAGTNQYGVSMTATESASPAADLKKEDPFNRETGIKETSMVSAVLPCVKTAREGIRFLADLVDTYGAGEGNTLMIGDKNECWYMEILTGHQYVAVKMPDDKAAIMPNCFMLEEVDLSDTENVIASKDIIGVAERAGTLVRGEGENTIHVRKSYSGAMGEGNSYRIWGGQIILDPGLTDEIQPTDQELPMFVDPEGKVSVKTMYKIAGSRYEGTKYEGKGRVIGTPSSVECHIFQVRQDMPVELETIEWLCMGSADLSTFVPYYSAAITDTHPAYQVQNLKFDQGSAYWTFRSLAALSEVNRSGVAVNVKQYWSNYMDDLISRQAEVDANMLALYQTNPAAVSEKATGLGMAVADEAIGIAKSIHKELGSTEGVPMSAYVPGRLTQELYSAYSFDMKYDPGTPEQKPSPEPDVKPETPSQEKPEVTAPAEKTVTAAVPQKIKVKAKKKNITVSFKKVKGAVSYKVKVSTGKKFKASKTRTITVKTNKAVIKKLKPGKKYYVKVLAVKKADHVTINGPYSKAVQITTKK